MAEIEIQSSYEKGRLPMAEVEIQSSSEKVEIQSSSEKVEFQSVWIGHVKDMIGGRLRSPSTKVRFPRVGSLLLTTKREAYIPRFISLGPYHHSKLERDGTYQYCGLKMSAAEAYKVISAATIYGSKILAEVVEESSPAVLAEAEGEVVEESQDTCEGTIYGSKILAEVFEDSQDTCEGTIYYASKRSRRGRGRGRGRGSRREPRYEGEVVEESQDTCEGSLRRPRPRSPDPMILPKVLKKIKEIQTDIVSSYDLQIPPDPDFLSNYALMMVVDACFLLYFIFGCLGFTVSEDFGLDIELYQLRVWIKCDILKLENQIPLSVLELVFADARELFVGPFRGLSVDSFKELLQAAYKELSPFDMLLDVYHRLPPDAMDDLEKEPHILGCIHRIVSGILELDLLPGGTLPQRIYSFIDKYVVKLCGIFFCFTPPTDIDRLIKGAGQLARAGVKFKSFSKWNENIRFEEYSHTLYLPYLKIISSLQTEVFFRNLVALEFNEPARPRVVTHYVKLMDSLIDTPDDVRALMDADVISCGSLITEKDIAQMWDGMCQPFVKGDLEPEPPLMIKNAFVKDVETKYYKVKVKIRIAETWGYFYERFFSAPWKILALLLAIFLIFLNCIQAYCSLYKCGSDS